MEYTPEEMEQNDQQLLQQEWEERMAELNAGWPDIEFARAVEIVNSRGMIVCSPKMYALAMAKRGVN